MGAARPPLEVTRRIIAERANGRTFKAIADGLMATVSHRSRQGPLVSGHHQGRGDDGSVPDEGADASAVIGRGGCAGPGRGRPTPGRCSPPLLQRCRCPEAGTATSSGSVRASTAMSSSAWAFMVDRPRQPPHPGAVCGSCRAGRTRRTRCTCRSTLRAFDAVGVRSSDADPAMTGIGYPASSPG